MGFLKHLILKVQSMNASIEVKGNGNFNAVYNANVINNLAAGSNPVVAIVPGSWRDW